MEIFVNLTSATLASGINSSATSLPLTTGHGARFGAITAGDKIRVAFLDATKNVTEIAYMTAIAGDTATIVRGQDGTSGTVHLAGDTIEARIGKSTMEAFTQKTKAGTDAIAEAVAATSKATPVDADILPIADSAASNALKKLTWANIKATLKTYFDTIYTFAGIVAQGGNLTGAINEARGTVAMHATTMDLWTSKPDILDGTGSAVTITAIANAPQAGARRTLYPIAGTVITNGATFAVDGAANYTTASGDGLEFEAITTSTYKVHILKKDGTPIVAPTQIQPISASVGSSALTISASALSLDFRSTTAGSGTVTRVAGTPANLVISSGSTLGTTSAQLSRLAVLALNNAGTIELAVVNVASSLVLDETGLISTTAEGGAGAADSATVIYSTTARTNVAYRVLGYIESTQATAGTWATAPSAIQGAGGNEIITSRITTSATIATTSGTSIDITGIPPWVKRVWLILDGVSGNGTSSQALQLGTASGIETSGYVGNDAWLTGNVSSASTPASSFQLVNGAAATDVHTGVIELINMGGNRWILISQLARTVSNIGFHFAGGSKTLVGPLDRIRLTTVGGADTFDLGSITATWE